MNSTNTMHVRLFRLPPFLMPAGVALCPELFLRLILVAARIDRPLQHINKKGRPVSQCQHCRSMRKSRAAHIKCDCGEKTSKCAHLQQTVEGHRDTCCCNHGGRCTCCLKKDSPLDTVRETDSESEHRPAVNGARAKVEAARRRRANTDGGLVFDEHGHHKPSAKPIKPSQKSGPYQLNRVNSGHSSRSLGSSAENVFSNKSNSHRSRASSVREPRKVKSEAASPLMSCNGLSPAKRNPPPLDLSSIEYPSYLASGTPDLFNPGLSDLDAPTYSAGLTATSVDWSHYDLGEMKSDNFAPSSYSQTGTQSYSGVFDFGSSEQLPHLANTTSTSGNVSEVEDFMAGGDGGMDSFASNGLFRQGNMFSSVDLTSIDYDSFAGDVFAKGNNDNGAMIGGGVSLVEDDPAFWVNDYANENTFSAMDESPDPLAPTALSNFWEA